MEDLVLTADLELLLMHCNAISVKQVYMLVIYSVLILLK